MLAISTFATKSYCYALEAQAPLVVANLRYAGIDPKQVLFIFAGDESRGAEVGFKAHASRLEAMGAQCMRLKLKVGCNENKAHAKDSNLVIARLQNAAFDAARIAGASQFWSLESDILPRPNVLRSLMDALAFDCGHYDVANALYCNEEIISGNGTPQNWILPNVYPDEREVPPDLRAWLDYRARRQRQLAEDVHIISRAEDAHIEARVGSQPSSDEVTAWQQLDRDLEACPPQGNVFQLNAIKWRLRGWFTHAYPGIGLGAMVPVRWAGVGCNLFSERALNILNFIGYNGGSTQDLWLYWRCIAPAEMRAVAVSHATADHVKMRPAKVPKLDKDGKPVFAQVPKLDEHGEPVMENGKPVMVDGDPVLEDGLKPVIHHLHHQLGTERHGHLNQETRDWDGL